MRKKSNSLNLFLFLSLLLHAGLIYLAYHYYRISEEIREETFLVNLIEPFSGTAKDETKNDQISQNEMDQTLSPPSMQNRFMEATVSLDAPEPEYAAYITLVKRRIDSAWDYPEPARKARIDGSLALRFSILKTGIVNQLSLLRSSGYTRLDDEALKAIKVSSPFPPLPEYMQLSRLNILATFEYRIEQEYNLQSNP